MSSFVLDSFWSRPTYFVSFHHGYFVLDCILFIFFYLFWQVCTSDHYPCVLCLVFLRPTSFPCYLLSRTYFSGGLLLHLLPYAALSTWQGTDHPHLLPAYGRAGYGVSPARPARVASQHGVSPARPARVASQNGVSPARPARVASQYGVSPARPARVASQ
jgi:hypothetical protein